MEIHESSSRTYRVGLVGAGGIAPEHAEALGLLNGLKIVSVCDLWEQRALSLAQQYRIPRTYASLKKMLAHEHLDVVHVLTQPQHHVEPTLDCLRAGANVYVEKPMGLSTNGCRLVAAEAATQGLSVGVNHHLARNRLVDEIVQAARCKRFGKIVHVAVSYAVGAGSLPTKYPSHYMFSTPQSLVFEYCPHPFSIIRRLLGKPIDITALVSAPAQLSNGKKYYQSWQIAAVADRGTAEVRFSVGQVNTDVCLWVYGQDACAKADLRRGTLLFHENCPFPITANLRDGLRNSGRLLRQSIGAIWDDYTVKLKLKPAALTNSFYPALATYYAALRGGYTLDEDAKAGEDVIAYCEMAVANMRVAG